MLFRVPTALHRAMRIVAEDNPYPYGSLQSLVSMTISKYFDKRPGNPRLMPYPEPKGGPSIQVSVLIDPDLSKRVHMISILTGTPIRHIVTGAILDNLKDSPSIKDLHLGEMVEPPVLDGKLPK
ncbi:hypothetical protein CEY11_24875 [Candidimonas nitroreducens]|uniref:Uncharacterized protein n=1 Tax=Candidimonas nitroreducens TaxID=683354 RepID=A0A225M1E9_9BURK|nr:hypothetical protein CEY11_24875 [Candidimonas nitroreducens]